MCSYTQGDHGYIHKLHKLHDLTNAVVGGTQTEMKIDPNIAANPAYEAVKCDQEDHTYDVVSEGVAGFKTEERQLIVAKIFVLMFHFDL